MANLVPLPGQAKVYNRNVRLAKGAALIQGDDFSPMSFTVRNISNADNIDQNIYTANRACKIIGVSEVHTTAGSDGGAVTLNIKKCTGTTAPASGTSILTTTINLKGVAQTVQTGSLVAVGSTLTLAAGDRIALDYTGTITALAGVVITFDLIPV